MSLNSGNGISRLVRLPVSDAERGIYVFGDSEAFADWLSQIQRPSKLVLTAALDSIARYSLSDLTRAGHLFKKLAGTEPPIYEIRKNQARLLCCMMGANIVILHWLAKKKDKLAPEDVKKAERLAREVFSYVEKNWPDF